MEICDERNVNFKSYRYDDDVNHTTRIQFVQMWDQLREEEVMVYHANI